MKIIVIGDIHGHDTWKRILAQEITYDLIVFLGDYCDALHIPYTEIISNYKEIRVFQQSNPDKVITLMGNHELHYLINTKYSGWNPSTFLLLGTILQEDEVKGLLPIIHQVNNYIFSHAGITKTWLNRIKTSFNLETDKQTIDYINQCPLQYFDISYVNYDSHGDSAINGPLWVRPFSLLEDKLDDYIQVVGHTEFKNHKVNVIDNVYFCDALPNEYLIIEDNNFRIKQLK